MKVVGGTSEAVNKTFSGSSWWGTSTRGFGDETRAEEEDTNKPYPETTVQMK